MPRVLKIRIDSIEPNLRSIVIREVLEELCRSLSLHGQSEPISVFFTGRSFRIIDGEKRWRACRKLGYSRILARIELDEPESPDDDWS